MSSLPGQRLRCSRLRSGTCSMQVRFALPGPIEVWSSAFVDRTTVINSKLRQDVKQRMYYARTQLAILYGNGEGEQQALNDLEQGVTDLHGECATAVTQLAEVHRLVAEVCSSLSCTLLYTDRGHTWRLGRQESTVCEAPTQRLATSFGRHRKRSEDTSIRRSSHWKAP